MKRGIWILTFCVCIAACAEAGETGTRYLAQLSEDTTVELVGIRPYSAGQPQRARGESGPWWSPDGTPLLMPPDKRFDVCTWSDSYLFVITVEGETDCDFRAIGPWDHDLTIVPTREWEKGKGLENTDLRRFTLRGGTQKSADIRLRVATGEWEAIDRWFIRPNWTPYNLILGSLEKVILRCPEQKDSDVVAEVTQIITERATRLVVFDKDGNRYESEGEIRGEGDGLVRHVHKFKNLDKNNIERMEFQAREYDYWITFGNVSLQTGHETQVKIDIKQPGALLRGNSLPGFDDIEVDFAVEDNKGKMLLICFFDMNQRPSRNCARELAKRAKKLKQNGVVVVAVQASRIDQDSLDEWTVDSNIPFPVGMIVKDPEKTRLAWGVKSLPWLILTDSRHIVAAAGFGLSEFDEKIKAVE